MAKGLTLKTRLNLSIAALLAAIALLGSFLVIHHVRQSVAEETESALKLARELVAAVRIQGPLPQDEIEKWQSMLGRLNQLRHVRLSIGQDVATIRNEPLSTSGVPSWFVRWVLPPSMHEEHILPIAPHGELKLTLIANPQDEIAEAWQETKVFLGLIALLAIGFFLAVAIVLGRAFRPVEAILKGFLALERGDYHLRLPMFSSLEFTRIAQAFNHCAEVLEKTRTENRKLTRQLLKVEEEERRQLALELHDELGQTLSAIKVMALSIQKTSGTGQVAHAAQTITASVDHLFQLLRSMIQRLRPLMLDDLGLSAAIASLVSTWREKQADTRIHLHCDETIDGFPKEGWIHVYRIVQEALTNAFKHARAKEIQVNLSWQTSQVPPKRWLRVQVADDGRGIALDQQHGCGLKGIRERVESLNGRLEIESRPSAGFCISAWLPCEERNANAYPHHAR
ncbi:MAG: ATP-binding protein [Methylohalobius sp.]|nr:ATP-binding protein [Methylohalobius sp.]